MNNVFATKLKELRERKNLSYQDVADMIGVAKQSIFKFEKGFKNPSSDTVLKLAREFNVAYEYFYESESIDNIVFDHIEFREDHKLFNKETVEAEIKQSVITFLNKFSLLERILDEENNYNNPVEGCSITSKKDVEKAAKLLRKKWKLGYAPIADVIELLEDKGIIVIEVKRLEDFTGLSGKFNETIPIIVLNENYANVERKRFTALHELAHLILEFEEGLTKEKIEWLCNFFAGAVLLVDEVLFEKLGRNRTTISLAELKNIKEVYGIAISAIIVRAKSTGFIGYDAYQDWWKSYNEWTENKGENDFGKYTAIERPSRFNKLLFKSVHEKKLSISKAAELAGKKEDYFMKELDELNFNLK